MDPDRLPKELDLDEQAIKGLRQAGLVKLRPQTPPPKPRTDYAALQRTYRELLADGGFAGQADLARHLEVSRVWVSRVLKGIKSKAG